MTKYLGGYAKLSESHFNASLISNHGETDLSMHGTIDHVVDVQTYDGINY